MVQLAHSEPGPVNGRRNGKSAEAFRTISEVAQELAIPQHVVRFWESKFSQVKPLKRGGGRRYYRPENVALLRNIRTLLYNEGYTIKGVQKLLREGQVSREDALVKSIDSGRLSDTQRHELNAIIDELTELKKLLTG